ncbi:hypothetical protein CIW48_05665 [Methylobacterium sp. P1-11]|nr:hypothetical protein CIW48_05665 [Methylobacterium sp. P1-11]
MSEPPTPDDMNSVKGDGFDGWPDGSCCNHVDPQGIPQRAAWMAAALMPDGTPNRHWARPTPIIRESGLGS